MAAPTCASRYNAGRSRQGRGCEPGPPSPFRYESVTFEEVHDWLASVLPSRPGQVSMSALGPWTNHVRPHSGRNCGNGVPPRLARPRCLVNHLQWTTRLSRFLGLARCSTVLADDMAATWGRALDVKLPRRGRFFAALSAKKRSILPASRSLRPVNSLSRRFS